MAMTAVRHLAFLLGWAMVLAGCKDRPATQVVISVATDLKAPVPLQKIGMKIERFDQELNDYVDITAGLTADWLIDEPPAGFELPGSVVSYSGKGAEPRMRVTVTAFNPSNQRMLRRQSIFTLVKEKTLFMRMGVVDKCFQDADCPEAKTCIEGRCKDIVFKRLPLYEPEKRPEFSVQCQSGTSFINTRTGMPLPLERPDQSCPDEGVCIEGACYPRDVFGGPLPVSQALTVHVTVTDPNGMVISPVTVRPEDGPVSLVRKLRDGGFPDVAAGTLPTMTGAGPHQIPMRADPLTTELRLTVSAPGFAPQVVTVPYKGGVTRYNVPVILFPLLEQTLVPGQVPTLPPLSGGGRTATVKLPAATAMGKVRYALMDGRYLPGQAIASGTGGLLQSVAVLYLENSGQSAFPVGSEVVLGPSSTPAVFGAEGGAWAYVLDLQGQWKRPELNAFQENALSPKLSPKEGGFWTIANHTPQPACVRGRLLRPGGIACSGAQVRLLGPEGVSSVDSTGPDGSFCGAAAQREAALLAVGTNVRTIYVPAPGRIAPQCSDIVADANRPAQSDACTDLGDILMRDEDCERPAPLVAGRKQRGEACTGTLECAGLASCFQGYCVGEAYVRVSMSWTVRSDFDLNVKLPDGLIISTASPEVKGIGRLDVEQCAVQCLGERHVESVLLSSAAKPGTYEVWVKNFGVGVTAGDATVDISVAGQHTTRQVFVPGTEAAQSETVTFTLP